MQETGKNIYAVGAGDKNVLEYQKNLRKIKCIKLNKRKV